eukprot:757983_1
MTSPDEFSQRPHRLTLTLGLSYGSLVLEEDENGNVFVETRLVETVPWKAMERRPYCTGIVYGVWCMVVKERREISSSPCMYVFRAATFGLWGSNNVDLTCRGAGLDWIDLTRVLSL